MNIWLFSQSHNLSGTVSVHETGKIVGDVSYFCDVEDAFSANEVYTI